MPLQQEHDMAWPPLEVTKPVLVKHIYTFLNLEFRYVMEICHHGSGAKSITYTLYYLQNRLKLTC